MGVAFLTRPFLSRTCLDMFLLPGEPSQTDSPSLPGWRLFKSNLWKWIPNINVSTKITLELLSLLYDTEFLGFWIPAVGNCHCLTYLFDKLFGDTQIWFFSCVPGVQRWKTWAYIRTQDDIGQFIWRWGCCVEQRSNVTGRNFPNAETLKWAGKQGLTSSLDYVQIGSALATVLHMSRDLCWEKKGKWR